MLSLWSVRMVCVWITVSGDMCCSTVTSMCWAAGFTDVFFYSDCTNPYAGYVLDLKKLKVYNQFIYPLAMILNRKL